MAEDYIQYLSVHAVPKAMGLSEIQEATKDDPTLQQLAQMIRGECSEHTVPFSDKVDQAQLNWFLKSKMS